MENVIIMDNIEIIFDKIGYIAARKIVHNFDKLNFLFDDITKVSYTNSSYTHEIILAKSKDFHIEFENFDGFIIHVHEFGFSSEQKLQEIINLIDKIEKFDRI